MPAKVLFVVPPWLAPNMSSLAIGTLCPILRAHGIEVDELHGSTMFPVTENGLGLLESFSKFLFIAALNDTPLDAVLDEVVEMRREGATLMGILDEDEALSRQSSTTEEFCARFRIDIAAAETVLQRMVAAAEAQPYDIVAFSATFDTQVPAALAMARRLRARRPELKVILGGAACLEEQGDGLLHSFAELDAVCHCEGEEVIVPLIRALRDGAPLAGVPGICWRDERGEVRHNPSPALTRDMDTLPVPDYRAFVAQFAGSEWASELAPRLLFETSRGCWWGQKSLCTFCGLNGEGLAFRSKTPERAYDEIVALYRDYPTATFLQSTDNILDLKYLTTVMPRLAALPRDPDRPLRIFYEVKSNMRPDQVEAMALAGVVCVQPGIESFSTDVLRLMRKGCTALGQVQFIKWCDQFGINPVYNVILRNPGEEVAWYRRMLEVLPSLHHLTPPTAVVPMLLERFSPYFQDPASFGITNVQPKSFYTALYNQPGVDLERIAYQFGFEHPVCDDRELIQAYRACADDIRSWQETWAPDRLYYQDLGKELVVVDSREGGRAVVRLAGPAMELFRYLDTHRARAGIAAEFPDLDAQLLETQLLNWTHRRWIVSDEDRVVSVVPRKGPAPPRADAPKRPRPRTTLPVYGAVTG
ncbi:MAG: RiPP maturation radical SAM C-methyltransferase [Deltaproteobacteria bacterium]|nr:RiPP maturation radical SAM C-methyltransferase [Deltaproteobacteria bacterium]